MGEHEVPRVSLQYQTALDQLLTSTSQDLSSRGKKDLAVEDDVREKVWEVRGIV